MQGGGGGCLCDLLVVLAAAGDQVEVMMDQQVESGTMTVLASAFLVHGRRGVGGWMDRWTD